MSDDRASQAIRMTPARVVDVNEWLLVRSSDSPNVARAIANATDPRIWGGINLRDTLEPKQCGAIFVPEVDGYIEPANAALLQFFFTRDKAEAVVFEFDKFTGRFFMLRGAALPSRTRQ